jgi:alpha-amylase/alpha-mannosidase (GH57 family)
MDRYICIHGHFYQPPRENPWLEAIELQDSAAPYHDWNERITAECYAPNSASRILDNQDRIVKLINNYAKISFNFGPTLLSWLEAEAPDVYATILAADQESQKTFSGHGSAIAQVYNHMIMPLANSRDRATQIVWGMRDFEKRFKRAPEGMWLAETAVDTETLELLAEHGIRFTILAPHQAARVRQVGARQWEELHGAPIDSTRAYQQRLPSGRTIALFFYYGPAARAVAFEGALSQGERLIERLNAIFSPDREGPQLAHIATDGESYGHHHKFGEMALAYVLDQIEARQSGRMTNYGEFLEKFPPSHEVEIIEKSSWSCAHGIDRWWSDCGCNSGAHGSWNQKWRTPLRNALDWLRDNIAPRWEQEARKLLRSPWAARDAYIDVVLDRSAENLRGFLARHALRRLTDEETTKALKLLELQRHAMLMYTSCGWFFDELSGIETVQILQFAGRAAQLAQELFGDSLEVSFINLLAAAESNLREQGNGAKIYERHVVPAKVDWKNLAAHYAISALFENFPKEGKIHCYDSTLADHQVLAAGRVRLAFGRAELTSNLTFEAKRFSFGVLHLGDYHINGGVADNFDDQAYRKIIEEAALYFNRADFAGVLRVLARGFRDSNYSLQSLFRDHRRAVLDKILAANLNEAEVLYRQIYEPRAPLLRFFTELQIPLPKAFSSAAEFVLNGYLRAAFEQEPIEPARIRRLIETAKVEGVALDDAPLEFAFRRALERMSARFAAEPSQANLESFAVAASLLGTLPFTVNLWQVQNRFHGMLKGVYAARNKEIGEAARRWIRGFEELGHKLGIKVP